MKRIQQMALAMAIAVMPTLAFAASVDSHPGVLAIDWSSYVNGREPTVTVQISPTLLRFMTSVASEAASELDEVEGIQEIIRQVRRIKVEVHEGADDANLAAAAETEADKLVSAGWESVVRAREEDERVDVMILSKDQMIVGIVVIAAEYDELSFVNIAGDFEPELLGKHLGAIARQAKDGEVDLEELLGEAVLADLIDDEDEHHHDHDDDDDE